MGEVEMLEEDPNISPECLNFLWGPSIKDVHIKGRGEGEGEGVSQMQTAADRGRGGLVK